MRREGYEMQFSNPEVVTRELESELTPMPVLPLAVPSIIYVIAQPLCCTT